MPRDPYAELKAGEKLGGLPHQPWNDFLKLRKPKAVDAGAGRAGSSVEIRIKNTTAAALNRFAILKAVTPTFTFANDQESFFASDLMDGETPVVGSAFAVTLQPLSVGEIGFARVVGYCRVKVNIADTAHRFADCTTATDKLTSAATGSARILWDEDNFAATGDKWAVVDLLGTATGTLFVRFTLPSSLATTDASKASCTVDGYFGAGAPGSTITVFNLPASSNYIFSGASGHKGLAVYDALNSKFWIVQMECP